MTKYWIFLILAILLEVAGTTAMKLSDGFTKVIPSILMFVFYILSLVALAYALKRFEVSMAYAVWSEVGMTLIAIIGIVIFHESVTLLKVSSITLIIVGVVGLNLSSKSHIITPPTNNLNYAIITYENRCQKINPKRAV